MKSSDQLKPEDVPGALTETSLNATVSKRKCSLINISNGSSPSFHSHINQTFSQTSEWRGQTSQRRWPLSGQKITKLWPVFLQWKINKETAFTTLTQCIKYGLKNVFTALVAEDYRFIRIEANITFTVVSC